MSIARTTALRNLLTLGYGIKEALNDGVIYVFSGTQPSDPDATNDGTLLLKFTVNGNEYTDPEMSKAAISIGGAPAGTLDTITVGGMSFNLLSKPIPYNSTALQTASDIADNINAKQNPINITAEQDGDNVILRAPYWLGALADGLVFATTVSGSLTATSSGVFNDGVNAVNGLNFGDVATNGQINKTGDLWQATGLTNGTASYFRFVAGGSTYDGSSGNDIRFDGSVGTSNADLALSTIAIEKDSVYVTSTGFIRQAA